MKLTILLLCAATAFAQLPPKQSVTISLTATPTADEAKQIADLLRTVGQLPDASYDESRHSFSLTGFEHQLGLATWLVHAAEKPAEPNEYVMQPDLPIDDRYSVTRVHYLRNAEQSNLQEILTIARTVGGIQLAFVMSQPPMLALRGTASQAELGDWLAANLDVPAGSGYSSFSLPPQVDGTEDIVRIFFLNAGASPVKIQELATTIRTTVRPKAVFPKFSSAAIVVRGTSSVLSQVQQMIVSR